MSEIKRITANKYTGNWWPSWMLNRCCHHCFGFCHTSKHDILSHRNQPNVGRYTWMLWVWTVLFTLTRPNTKASIWVPQNTVDFWAHLSTGLGSTSTTAYPCILGVWEPMRKWFGRFGNPWNAVVFYSDFSEWFTIGSFKDCICLCLLHKLGIWSNGDYGWFNQQL